MAADVNIGAKISVDSDEAIKSTLLLKDNIKNLSKELRDAKAGSDEQVDAYKRLNAAQKELNDLNTQTVGGFGQLKDGLKNMVPGFDGAIGGAEGLKGKFIELLANPIVALIAAIVVGLKFLLDSFKDTTAGSKEFDRVMAAVGETISVLKEAAFAVGRGLIDMAKAMADIYISAYKFITLDFKGGIAAFDDAKTAATDALGQVNDAANKTADALSGKVAAKAFELKQKEQDLAKAKRESDLETDRMNTQLLKSRELLMDTENKDIDAKKKALEEVKAAETKASAETLRIATETLNMKRELWQMETDGLKKHADDLAELEKGVEEAKQEQLRTEIKLDKQTKQLNKQDEEDEKAAKQKAKDASKAERERRIEFQNKLDKLNQENKLALITDEYSKERQALENKIADEGRQITDSYKDGKLKLEEYNQLKAALKVKSDNELDALKVKHDEKVASQTADFEKQLAKIKRETELAGIDDVRKKELEQLKDSFIDKRNAIKAEGLERKKLMDALDAQELAAEKALKIKNEKEDAKTAIDNVKKIVTDATKTLKARKDALLAEQNLIKDAFNSKLLTEKEYNTKVDELAKERIIISKAEHEFKKAQVDEVKSITTGLTDVIGKQTAVGKGLAIATAVINTYQGASEALKQKSTLPSPYDVIAKVANVATIIATGLKTVQSIASVQVPGSGSSGASITNPTAPVKPTQTSTNLNASSIQGIGNATSASRSFVVEADITNNQERVARINRAARI